MPNYREGVQTKITFELFATDGSFYTTSGTPPTLKVQKNKSGAPATGTGTLAHEGSGLWSYIPASGEVSATCTALHLTWNGSGIQSGGVCVDFENDFTPTVSGRVDAAITSRAAPGAAMTLSADSVSAAALATDAVQEIRNAITGYAGALGDGSGRVVITPTDQATLIAAIWLAAGRTLSTISDSAGITTLLGRLSSARAGYLDALNVAGVLATQADITALNQSASRRMVLACVSQMERPESGSSTYTVEMRTYDGDGAAANATATPTIVPTGIVSGSLAVNLGAVSNPSTGVYRATYTVAFGHALEQVRFDGSAVMSDGTFTLSAYSQVCDFVAANFTTSDRTLLTSAAADALAAKTRAELGIPAAAPGASLGVARVTDLPAAPDNATIVTAAADALAAKNAAVAAQARAELALPAQAPNTNNGLPIKSNLPVAPDNAGIAAGAASAATAAAQSTTAAADILLTKTRVLLGIPAAAPGTNPGLALKSDVAGGGGSGSLVLRHGVMLCTYSEPGSVLQDFVVNVGEDTWIESKVVDNEGLPVPLDGYTLTATLTGSGAFSQALDNTEVTKVVDGGGVSVDGRFRWRAHGALTTLARRNVRFTLLLSGGSGNIRTALARVQVEG